MNTRITTIFTAIFAIAITFTPAAFAQTDITSEFTDENFRNKVCTAISKSAGCTINKEEVETVTTLSVNSSNIASLAGIEYFTALTTLNVQSNKLTEIDVSNNTALRTLNVQNNQLTELDVSKNTVLTTLYVYDNQLTEIDVSNNTALRMLGVGSNQLTEIDVSKNTTLTSLNVSSNQLTELDVSNNTALTTLNVYGNQLTELDVSKNTALRTLDVQSNQLTEIDVSNNTALDMLNVEQNRLTTLDVSGLSLYYFYCEYNYLSSVTGWSGSIGVQHATGFIAATRVLNVPTSATIGVPLTLTGTVFPSDATNKTITEWFFYSDGNDTGADIDGNVFTAERPRSIWLCAVVENGSAVGEEMEECFLIHVKLPVPTYAVTVSGGTGGGSYKAGETVTITATVPSGKKFKNWTATGVTLANANSATTTFTMPATAVTITAVFEDEDDGTDPIRLPQIASSNIHAYAMGNNIVLQNLPAGAKVEVYGLNGKLITTSHSPLATSHLGSDMSISVQTKGMYIVKTGTQIFRVAVR